MRFIIIITFLFINVNVFSQIDINTSIHVNRQLFPVWQTDSEVHLAAEIAIQEYPDNFLMSNLLSGNIKDKNQPELLVINDFQASLKGDIAVISQNYYDKEAKKQADAIIKNIEKIKKQRTEQIKDIILKNKSQFGETIRIRYDYIKKDNTLGLPWASLCKKIGNRYYFVSATSETELLISLSEACPYWNKNKLYLPKEKLNKLLSLSFSPESQDLQLNKDTRIDLYINIKKFMTSDEISFNNEILKFMDKMKKAYMENNKEIILSLWLPDRHSFIKSANLNNGSQFNKTRSYFTQTDKFILDFYVGTFDDSFVFARRMVNGQIEENSLKILKFKRQNGTLYFTDFPSDYCYLAGNILENPLMLPFYKQIIEANTKH